MVVNNEELSPQEELVQDIVSILHVFSCRRYGLRKYKKKQIEGMMKFLKSYKTEIDPTPEQKQRISRTISTCRYVYNFYIAHNRERYEKGEKFMTGKASASGSTMNIFQTIRTRDGSRKCIPKQ